MISNDKRKKWFSNKDTLVMKSKAVKIAKEVKRSADCWCFACGDVFKIIHKSNLSLELYSKIVQIYQYISSTEYRSWAVKAVILHWYAELIWKHPKIYLRMLTRKISVRPGVCRASCREKIVVAQDFLSQKFLLNSKVVEKSLLVWINELSMGDQKCQLIWRVAFLD